MYCPKKSPSPVKIWEVSYNKLNLHITIQKGAVAAYTDTAANMNEIEKLRRHRPPPWIEK